ncbi:hypothetical protein C4573_06015 [Candidatus Woesearchaeota archaeon]|nr:MAG: hypothetical protein C4573_06015 [Candidatus Woesearchaeota archaeon]
MKILILALLLLTAACTAQIQDTTIVYKTYGGFVMQEMAVQELTITKDTVTYRLYHANGSITEEQVKPIDAETYANLLVLFENFSALDDLYEQNPALVTDVGIMELTMQKGGITKTVKVDPFYKGNMPEQLQAMTQKIYEIIENTRYTKIQYEPVQCEETPWQAWYATGELQFFAQATDEQIMIPYYANKHNANLINIERINRTEAVCEACGVCKTHHYFTAQTTDVEKMLQLNWTIAE